MKNRSAMLTLLGVIPFIASESSTLQPRTLAIVPQRRGGEIILNTPARRAIFLSGLIGAVVLAVILMIVR